MRAIRALSEVARGRRLTSVLSNATGPRMVRIEGDEDTVIAVWLSEPDTATTIAAPEPLEARDLYGEDLGVSPGDLQWLLTEAVGPSTCAMRGRAPGRGSAEPAGRGVVQRATETVGGALHRPEARATAEMTVAAGAGRSDDASRAGNGWHCWLSCCCAGGTAARVRTRRDRWLLSGCRRWRWYLLARAEARRERPVVELGWREADLLVEAPQAVCEPRVGVIRRLKDRH
jgi:hypothetical protein